MITDVDFSNIKFKMCIPHSSIHNNYFGGNVQSEILYNKVWAKDETQIMNKILSKKKGKVIDVGANTGYFTFIGLIHNCPVIAIEPNKIHTQYFNKTIEINNFSKDNILHLECFVSIKQEKCSFDGWTGNDKLLLTSISPTVMVDTVSLDSICDECLFLKIDVEGNEPDVIKSARRLLENEKINYIMFEITYIINNKVDNENIEMLNMLKKYGFTLYEIIPNILNEITNITNKVNQWEYEYFNCHQKANPSITCGGTNILAIHNKSENIFTKTNNIHQFYI
jgi:FkbM family methyltransferase